MRVTVAFALAMAVVLSASGFYLYLRLSSHLALAMKRDLQLRSQDLTALVTQAHGSLAREDSSRFLERGESYAQLIASNGRVLDATRAVGRAPVISQAQLRRALRAPIYLNLPRVPGLDEGSRVLATAVSRRSGPAVLVVGVTRQNNIETLASFRNELVVAGPVALILASAVGYLLAGVSLRQVEAMRRRAAAISADTPGERLPVPATGDELQRLGSTLNEMLDRLEAALQRERDFLADAGHELRTPLALLRTELELALHQASTPEELRDAVLRSSDEAERLSQLAEDLLLIAQADRRELPLRVEDVEAGNLLGAVKSRFEWRAGELGKHLVIRPADDVGLELRGDKLRLEQAVSNLVDNALRYGGDRVRLSASAVDGSVELHVEDNGVGFPPEYLERAFGRFTQPNAARSQSGAGLGLAIVLTIAQAHGGTAGVANVANGVDAWLSVPRSVTEGREGVAQ
jgi:signal transduction histidine kinase